MKNFIKATEVWIPNSEKTMLHLKNGIYSGSRELEAQSKDMVFHYDEGLPGKAWASKSPIILTELEGSYFKRTELVKSIGLTTAIAMPIFVGEYLTSVIVFLCGDSEKHAGAIEVWKESEDRRNELGLVSGYYGTMEDFAWISKSVKIMKGQGLPGTVWKTGMPFILGDLGKSATFLRAKKALKEGITTAFAIPAWIVENNIYVMTFLSAKGTPIARRFEVWIPNSKERTLTFSDGHSDDGSDLKKLYANESLSKDESILGNVWKSAVPALVESSDIDNAPSNATALLAFPIIQNGFCKAIVAFYY
jgi:hypothetical protein